ncbi:putative disease resistance protein RGA3 [Macadamia integrifolia]|uniref:putative disease resistance protein RGA3 n=1 Tax=Macadamia integrifolia TaxID=60698 RepID=UPI001C4FD346|nr:putative disease resistance protein RGA3 [Macadamia integrifolia]
MIIVTTRRERVASMMNPIQTHSLRALSEEDCLLLFKKMVCTDKHDIHPGLEAIGRQIVQKRMGLPGAVDAVADHLQNKIDKHGWEMILEDDWCVPEENNSVLRWCFSYALARNPNLHSLPFSLHFKLQNEELDRLC